MQYYVTIKWNDELTHANYLCFLLLLVLLVVYLRLCLIRGHEDLLLGFLKRVLKFVSMIYLIDTWIKLENMLSEGSQTQTGKTTAVGGCTGRKI